MKTHVFSATKWSQSLLTQRQRSIFNQTNPTHGSVFKSFLPADHNTAAWHCPHWSSTSRTGRDFLFNILSVLKMGLTWGCSLRVASLSFSRPLIHGVHCEIFKANKFQPERLVISTVNSRGKTKQNLSVRTLSLRKFISTPVVIHSAFDCFLPTSSYLFLFTKWT